jgi:hypothetical protein
VRPITLILIFFLLLYNSGCDPVDKRLNVINLLNKRTWVSVIGDTGLCSDLKKNGRFVPKDARIDFYFQAFEQDSDTLNIVILDKWDNSIKISPDKRLHFFYFSDSMLLQKPILSVCKDNYDIKHLAFTHEELEQMKWFVVLK